MTHYQVFFASDRNYVIPMAVTIRSLIEHANPANHYDLYIATDLVKMDPSDIQKFKSMETDSVSITFVDSSLIDQRLDPNSRACFKHISLDTFARFYLDRLIPSPQLVLYLDVDLLIKDDVAKIFAEAITSPGGENFLLASVPMDPSYFNAGVILFNVEQMKNQGYFDRLIDYAVKNKVDDELAMNSVIPKNRVVNLSNRWNCAPSDLSRLIWDPQSPAKLWSSHKDHGFARKLTAAFQDPGIIHYLGAQKPWNYQIKASFPHQVIESFYQDWWTTYQKSPYYDPATYQTYQSSYAATLEDIEAKRLQIKKKDSASQILKKLAKLDYHKFWRVLRRKLGI